MSDMRCEHCYAETSNGLALCEMCTLLLSKTLEWIPTYFVSLARWRPGSAGVRSVPGSREPRLVSSGTDRVSRLLDEAGALMVGWARALVDDRPQLDMPASNGEASSVRVACLFLSEHLTTIGTVPWAGDIVTETVILEGRLRKLTEAVTPGWYAGQCKVCEADTFMVPGLTWVTCQSCGRAAHATECLETIIGEARGWVASPKALAGFLVATHHEHESVLRMYELIRKWGQREGKTAKSGEPLRSLTAVRKVDADGDPCGPKRYRLDDVLRMLDEDKREAQRLAEAAADARKAAA